MMQFDPLEFGNCMLYCLTFTTEFQYEYFKVFGYQSEDRFILMKTKQSVHIMVFGMVIHDGDVMPPFIFTHGLRPNMEVYITCLVEAVRPWIARLAVEIGLCAMPQRQKNPGFVATKFITSSPLTSGRLTPQNTIPLSVMCGVQLCGRPTKLRVTLNID